MFLIFNEFVLDGIADCIMTIGFEEGLELDALKQEDTSS